MIRRVLECPECGSPYTRETAEDILVCLDCGTYFEAEDVLPSRKSRRPSYDEEV